MQFHTPFHSVVATKLLDEEELLQTASFFHPHEADQILEMTQSGYKSPPQLKNKIGSYKPPKPSQQDTASRTSKQSSKQGSPQDNLRRPGVKYVTGKKTQEIMTLPEGPSKIQTASMKRPSNSLKVLKKQSLTQQQPIMVSEKKVLLPNSPPINKSRMHVTLQQRNKLQSPPTSNSINNDELLQSADGIKYNSLQDPTQLFIENHEKFLLQVQLQQIHQHQMLQQKKIQQDIKFKQLQQRLTQTPKKIEQIKIEDDIDDGIVNERQLSSQSSLQNSQLFKNSRGSFFVNGVQNYKKDIDYKLPSKLAYKSVQKITDQNNNINFLPRINSGKESIRSQIQNSMRKSQTAQENLREQLQTQAYQEQPISEKQESTIILPQIYSPQSGTLQGFGTSKQGGKSFLTRRPQAKIVSRIFSSKSDKN